MRTLSVLLGLAIVGGCAGEPASQQVATATTTPHQQTCHREAPVGSNRPVTMCYDSSGEEIDPTDPNKQRAIDDAARQAGTVQRQMGRASGGGR